MQTIKFISAIFLFTILTGCNNGESNHDASGTFEAEEVIVSSELPGKLLSFNVQEGQVIAKDSIVGFVDAKNISLQQEQVEANIRSLNEKTANVKPQIQFCKIKLLYNNPR